MRVEIVLFAIKFLGSACVLAGCGATAVLWCTDITNRKKMLMDFHHILLKIQGDIRVLKEPLYQVMENVHTICLPEFLPFWKHLSTALCNETCQPLEEIWRTHVSTYLTGTSLKADDLEIISDMGRMIGSHDYHMQSQIIDLFIQRVETQINTITLEMTGKKRLYGGLWVLGGIFLIVLFV